MIKEYYDTTVKSAFVDLRFEEQRHLYFWKGVRVPKSVSAKIHEHEVPFNAQQVLRNGQTLIQASAAKASRLEGRVITEVELNHRWQTKNITACELGTETHDYMEYFDGTKAAITSQQQAGVKFLRWLLSEKTMLPNGKESPRYIILYKELRMYSVQYDFAGTMDLLILDVQTMKFIIADYKTNGDLFKTYGWLKPPFDYLESHPYNKYQLQLSYYQIILEEMTPHKVQERWIVYLDSLGEYKIFPTWDFKDDLKQYLKAA